MGWLSAFYNQNSSTIEFIGINALLGLSLYITLACGLLSLANAGFMAIGAYTSALLTLHRGAPFPVVLLAGALMPALLALPLGLPVLRLRGVFLAIATIGFGEVVRIFFLNWSYARGALGLNGIPQETAAWLIYVSLGVLLYFFWRLRRSKMGYALEAIRQDEAAARASGVNTTFYKLLAFIVGAAIAGFAGALQAHLRFIVDPNDFNFATAVNVLEYAVVGGMALFLGPVLGAALLTALPEALRHLTQLGIQPGPDRQLVSGIILLLVILFLPGGLVSLFQGMRPRFRLPAALRVARA
ncbi:MAG TPA: branched-chain amino acid ABC transporter permease [Dehalococcoidia bacterium]|nr:branched-chain amino acid ABC transporter permease [Dehalococcoidia bacterium]